MGDRNHNRHGPKKGGGAAVPLSWRAGTPSNTVWPGPDNREGMGRTPKAKIGQHIHGQ